MKLNFLFLTAAIILASCTPKSPEGESPVAKEADKKQIVAETILNRHSIRSFKPEQVPQEVIDTLLRTAINAPSANNKQPWEIRVIQKVEILDKIKALNAGIFHNSPTVIVIAKDKNNPSADLDCGILSQTIMLAAESMDLGTCPLGGLGRLLTTPEAKEITDSLELPEDYEVILAISLGYKNETPEAKPRDASKIKYIN
ncbi:nitroreductase [Parabacteroides sp. Marseille-P3160]|uniref:nitroreductase family protein n=1 Tax=Parabacteroides sp. Marseille-P3160 TaxID=1917887 RepID=UPI0009BA14BA|nr:nitroreductase [Parabacteroides sp. Marseille-P3160]